MQSFQITGIGHERFEGMFELSDQELQEFGAVRRVATESPGFPCRVSLLDALVGEELLLLPFMHQPAASPYRASGPIFVRRHARKRTLPAGEIPPYVSSRLISVRAYDAMHMMVSAGVCEGTVLRPELERHLGNAEVAYVHLHNARQGCFSCRVDRVPA